MKAMKLVFSLMPLLAACGGGSAGASPSGPSGGPQVVLRGTFALRDPGTALAQTGRFPDVLALPFSLPSSGMLQARIEYGSPSNNVSFTIVQ